jgi:hypothetical protein
LHYLGGLRRFRTFASLLHFPVVPSDDYEKHLVLRADKSPTQNSPAALDPEHRFLTRSRRKTFILTRTEDFEVVVFILSQRHLSCLFFDRFFVRCRQRSGTARQRAFLDRLLHRIDFLDSGAVRGEILTFGSVAEQSDALLHAPDLADGFVHYCLDAEGLAGFLLFDHPLVRVPLWSLEHVAVVPTVLFPDRFDFLFAQSFLRVVRLFADGLPG